MKTIWKYQLGFGLTKLAIPAKATILHAHEQSGQPHIWAEVDSSNPAETKCFEVFGTGFDMDDARRKYIGTVHIRGYVWHVYERI